MNSARNADHSVRLCERFVYSVVKITRLYDSQTWQTHLLRNSFFLDCAFQALIGWTGKLQSHGMNNKIKALTNHHFKILVTITIIYIYIKYIIGHLYGLTRYLLKYNNSTD